MKKILISLGVLILLAVGFYYFTNRNSETEQILVPPLASSPKNATYTIDGQKVTLVNGEASVPSVPGSSSQTVTKYFGNEVKYDFDQDGREDTAFLLTQTTSGSGIFYYLVVALNKESGYIGSEGVFIGDRISPQSTEMADGFGSGNIMVVNYADRKPGESFSTSPSVGKSLALVLDPTTLQIGQVEQNFEGEADPDRMNLGMKTWVWIRSEYNDGKTVTPKKAGKFTLTFGGEGKFTATTDCNSMGGQFSESGGLITFKNIYSTKMFCEGSQEGEFAKMLQDSTSFHFTGRGELIMDLKFDSGSVIFR